MQSRAKSSEMFSSRISVESSLERQCGRTFLAESLITIAEVACEELKYSRHRTNVGCEFKFETISELFFVTQKLKRKFFYAECSSIVEELKLKIPSDMRISFESNASSVKFLRVGEGGNPTRHQKVG